MDLDAYLARIGLQGPLPATLATLQAVHRAQARAIPYEAIDVFAGLPVSHDITAIHEKLIGRRRGGWCYEQNTLLAWALTALGFPVRRATAGAFHGARGADIMGNHVVLLVTVAGQDWLCDLGLGDALRAPLPLVGGEHRDGVLVFRLEAGPDGLWQFWNHPAGDPSNFIVDPGPADEDLLARKQAALQADPASSFRLNFQAMRMSDSGSTVIYGRVLRRTTVEGTVKSLIAGPAEMASHLERDFGICGVEIAPLWPRILARHATVFGHEDAPP